ncbi:hypothetical protein [Calycomorphotria hydatis]|uniref:Uncharacterized protein n=1 Tax=Calycomorphotria hydatis TaxID=2528027 RepID=A0A517T7P6_9PLAN|nr:hypothetical protein [Calycomorphotria hydatis]QDT64389.1 hypothetical protein V22_16230 [Calycomorphotria hydatis]
MSPFHLLDSSRANMLRIATCLGFLALACVLVVGCGSSELEYTELKRLDERLTKSDMGVLLVLFKSMSEEDLTKLPVVLAQKPSWAPERTLPVREMMDEELDRIQQDSSVERVSATLPDSRTVRHLLQHQKMTREQLAALYVSVGYAISKSKWTRRWTLENLVRRGEQEMRNLRSDSRPFNSLPADARHHILEKAAWVAVADRAERLLDVPDENVDFVEAYFEKLQQYYPAGYFQDPLATVMPRLEVYGVPFAETDPSRKDEDILWYQSHAIMGYDSPEKTAAETSDRF